MKAQRAVGPALSKIGLGRITSNQFKQSLAKVKATPKLKRRLSRQLAGLGSSKAPAGARVAELLAPPNVLLKLKIQRIADLKAG